MIPTLLPPRHGVHLRLHDLAHRVRRGAGRACAVDRERPPAQPSAAASLRGQGVDQGPRSPRRPEARCLEERQAAGARRRLSSQVHDQHVATFWRSNAIDLGISRSLREGVEHDESSVSRHSTAPAIAAPRTRAVTAAIRPNDARRRFPPAATRSAVRCLANARPWLVRSAARRGGLSPAGRFADILLGLAFAACTTTLEDASLVQHSGAPCPHASVIPAWTARVIAPAAAFSAKKYGVTANTL